MARYLDQISVLEKGTTGYDKKSTWQLVNEGNGCCLVDKCGCNHSCQEKIVQWTDIHACVINHIMQSSWCLQLIMAEPTSSHSLSKTNCSKFCTRLELVISANGGRTACTSSAKSCLLLPNSLKLQVVAFHKKHIHAWVKSKCRILRWPTCIRELGTLHHLLQNKLEPRMVGIRTVSKKVPYENVCAC